MRQTSGHLNIRYWLVVLALLCIQHHSGGQSVGLVLSGGGASGLGHLGVIRALEEAEIPIDYITGTSIGGFVGALYSSGYSVDEITLLMTSERFRDALSGEIPEEDIFYMYRQPRDARLISLKVSTTGPLVTNLPTNIVSPALIDYWLLTLFAEPAAASGYDFNRLMIPFRCVAARISDKSQVVFNKGDLATAVRATTTYPFYFRPISVDGNLLFDGGLYNNFPSDVMYNDFLPDYIVGSIVTTNIPPPDEDDLLSQLKSMIMSTTNYSVQCENGVVIRPQSERGVFEFDNPHEEIMLGYMEAQKFIAQIKRETTRRRTASELDSMRTAFRNLYGERGIDTVKFTGITGKQRDFLKSIIRPKKKELLNVESFESTFFRLSQHPTIRNAYPTLKLDTLSEAFSLSLDVRPEKEITAHFGGNFSSRPINFGYVGLEYNRLGRQSFNAFANSYFGKFYGSFHGRLRIGFKGRSLPTFIPHFTLNRWDYFSSFATFFEESRPSFIVMNELFGGVALELSTGMHSLVRFDSRYGYTRDRYYQTDLFTAVDTSDFTTFENINFGIQFELNCLNRPQYAFTGKRLYAGARYINGRERTVFGTTLPNFPRVEAYHDWVLLTAGGEWYQSVNSRLHLGLALDGVFTDKPIFENYSASVISLPVYQPIPESRTLFQPEFRSPFYTAGGLRIIYEVFRNFEVRAEAYTFKPFQTIERLPDNESRYVSSRADEIYFIGSAGVVFNSPIGPLSLSANYYDSREPNQWSLLFNFGYLLFNGRIYE